MDIMNTRPKNEYPTQQDDRSKRIAYYIPWTFLALVVFSFLSPLIPNTLDPWYYVELSSKMLSVYVVCVLPPVIVYRFLKGHRRHLAYKLHVVWFITLTIIGLLQYAAGQSNGTLVTPHDIIEIRCGLKWLSVANSGKDAFTFLLASGLVGIMYLIEKRTKEKSRKAGDETKEES
jgi:branched-subunit amino acid ABC-type transport system permease component